MTSINTLADKDEASASHGGLYYEYLSFLSKLVYWSAVTIMFSPFIVDIMEYIRNDKEYLAKIIPQTTRIFDWAGIS